MTAGYSGTPLAKKLGIKEGFKILAVAEPNNYKDLLATLPEGVSILSEPRPDVDMVHFFTNSRDELFHGLPVYMRLIKQDGAMWVSWFKRAAKLPTEITEDIVRDAALAIELVDVKVCAVDEKWSGLKLVIRKENRL